MYHSIRRSARIVWLLLGLTIATAAGYGALPILLCFTILTVLFLGLERLTRIVLGRHREPHVVRMPRSSGTP